MQQSNDNFAKLISENSKQNQILMEKLMQNNNNNNNRPNVISSSSFPNNLLKPNPRKFPIKFNKPKKK